MKIIIIIITYLLSIIILYTFIFKKLFKKTKTKNLVLLQNNYELRGGGGLITQTLEFYSFLGIPYKIKKHTFSELNYYKQESFEPFKNLLSKSLIFRDINFSIFQEENYKKIIEFYKKNFKTNKIPDNIFIINFSFFEEIINFFPFISIKNFKLTKRTLFRNLSHITTDNPIGPEKRKFILFSLALKMLIYLFLIPFLIHIILIKLITARYKKDFYIINKNYKDIPKENSYLGIEENNLIGRKNNRFINNFIEYNFYIISKNKGYCEGVGKIKIHKTLFADNSFPISGDYTSVIKPIFSKHFNFSNPNYTKIFLKNGESSNTIYNFSFKIKEKGLIEIIKQSGIKNTINSINIQTKSFKYIPKTNLKNNIDHLHFQFFENPNNNIKVKYSFLNDISTLKIQSRFIINESRIQINFQKEIKTINTKKSFISYKNKKIPITKILHAKGNPTCLLIYYEKGKIPKYKFNKNISAYIQLFEITDSSNIIHYKKGRKVTLPWK